MTTDILSLIPQRPPFVMIDSLLYSDENRTLSSFEVKKENIFVTNGELREPGLVENIAQTAAARAGYTSKVNNEPVMIGYIGAVNNLQVFSLPKTGSNLETEVTIQNQVFNVTLITGTVHCRGELLARAEMKIFITPTK